MPNYARQDTATSNVLAWTAHATSAIEEEASAEVDEPPDRARQAPTASHPDMTSAHHMFEKTLAYRNRDRKESLLTRALQSQSEDEAADHASASGLYPRRRRSITSNASMASTAGFTSDTGITTPPRTNSPSPRLANIGFAPVHYQHRDAAKSAAPSAQPSEVDVAPKLNNRVDNAASTDDTATKTQAPPRKRCISFACGAVKLSQNAKPIAQPAAVPKVPGPDDTPKQAFAQLAQPTQTAQPTQAAQLKRPCIRFACPAPRPATENQKPQLSTLKIDGQENRKLSARKPSPAPELKSPTSRKFRRANSSGRSPHSVTHSSAVRQPSHSPLATRSKRYYNAGPVDVDGESSRFHGFASDAPLEDDWIRHGKTAIQQRLTIDDTLKKELAIRQLGKEAEEEAEQEEEDEENDDDEEEDDEDDLADEDEEEDDEDEDNEDDGAEDDEDDEVETVEGDNDYTPDERFAGYSSGDAASDGYNTDNENGFASSDEEDDGLVLWTTNQNGRQQRRVHNYDNDHSTLLQSGTPIFRRLSMDEHSDSSGFIAGQAVRQEKPKNRELAKRIRRPSTPELPDSTDFVCGTFDEDRPLEEAYMSHIEARKRGKLHMIPQDIDPSFPTSDPEESSDDKRKYKHGMQQPHGSADDRIWEMEDLHPDRQHDRTNVHRRKKTESPRRFRSPPPPKNRGRSPAPRRLFDRVSPSRRLKSPAPKAAAPVPIVQPSRPDTSSPPASLVEMPDGRGGLVFQTLAYKPGLTQTKSLPRPSAIFRNTQQQQPQQVHQQQHQQPKPHRRPKANSLTGAKQPRHVRGAIDIVKGLEQKRQRRKEKFQQRYCNRARKGHVPERRHLPGEGAERMREVGLFMAGKIPQGNFVLSI